MATEKMAKTAIVEKSYTPAQAQLFKLAYRAAEAVDKVMQTQLGHMTDWLKEQYGDTPPTYDQFWSDRDALKAIAHERGLVDDQWVRKPYNSAVKVLYGELPVSISLEAVAKRAYRPEVGKGRVAARPSKASLKLAYKVEMPKDAAAAVRQMLDRYGYGAVLAAFAQVLAEHRETAKEARRVEALAQEYAVLHPEERPQQKNHAMH